MSTSCLSSSSVFALCRTQPREDSLGITSRPCHPSPNNAHAMHDGPGCAHAPFGQRGNNGPGVGVGPVGVLVGVVPATWAFCARSQCYGVSVCTSYEVRWGGRIGLASTSCDRSALGLRGLPACLPTALGKSSSYNVRATTSYLARWNICTAAAACVAT